MHDRKVVSDPYLFFFLRNVFFFFFVNCKQVPENRYSIKAVEGERQSIVHIVNKATRK